MSRAARFTCCSLAVLALLAVPACGDGGGDRGGDVSGDVSDGGSDDTGPAAAGCGPDQQERIDPASANHVFAGSEEPEYLTDPPTSGPHAPGPPRTGVLDAPLSRPEQVGHLEAGGILLQHRDLPADQLAALEALADESVVVAPNADLPAPVVATAWTRKMVCETVDADALTALTAFAEAHRGGGPGFDG